MRHGTHPRRGQASVIDPSNPWVLAPHVAAATAKYRSRRPISLLWPRTLRGVTLRLVADGYLKLQARGFFWDIPGAPATSPTCAARTSDRRHPPYFVHQHHPTRLPFDTLSSQCCIYIHQGTFHVLSQLPRPPTAPRWPRTPARGQGAAPEKRPPGEQGGGGGRRQCVPSAPRVDGCHASLLVEEVRSPAHALGDPQASRCAPSRRRHVCGDSFGHMASGRRRCHDAGHRLRSAATARTRVHPQHRGCSPHAAPSHVVPLTPRRAGCVGSRPWTLAGTLRASTDDRHPLPPRRDLRPLGLGGLSGRAARRHGRTCLIPTFRSRACS